MSIIEKENLILKEKLTGALELASQYWFTEGEHHKIWLVDQILQTLMTSDEYKNFVEDIEDQGYPYDPGIAP